MRRLDVIDKTVIKLLAEWVATGVVVLGLDLLARGFAAYDVPLTTATLYLVGLGLIESALCAYLLFALIAAVLRDLKKLDALLKLRSRGLLE
jgi:hypothetical protein